MKVDGGCIIRQKFPKHFIKKEFPASSPLVSEEMITFLFNLAYSASGNRGGQPGLNHTAKATYLINEPLAQAWSQRVEKWQPGNGFLLHNTDGSDGAEMARRKWSRGFWETALVLIHVVIVWDVWESFMSWYWRLHAVLLDYPSLKDEMSVMWCESCADSVVIKTDVAALFFIKNKSW